ncbi:hypothetical protein MHBO_002417 [Bonamia ostreae]|uniref:Uncharacterized protein n=1 Tax=Bonamia ostreae TaxID=126728 RepID=A0ABV2AM93_9EUKA
MHCQMQLTRKLIISAILSTFWVSLFDDIKFDSLILPNEKSLTMKLAKQTFSNKNLNSKIAISVHVTASDINKALNFSKHILERINSQRPAKKYKFVNLDSEILECNNLSSDPFFSSQCISKKIARYILKHRKVFFLFSLFSTPFDSVSFLISVFDDTAPALMYTRKGFFGDEKSVL